MRCIGRAHSAIRANGLSSPGTAQSLRGNNAIELPPERASYQIARCRERRTGFNDFAHRAPTMISPSSTLGAEYGRSLMRMYGSSERKRLRTKASPSSGAGMVRPRSENPLPGTLRGAGAPAIPGDFSCVKASRIGVAVAANRLVAEPVPGLAIRVAKSNRRAFRLCVRTPALGFLVARAAVPDVESCPSKFCLCERYIHGSDQAGPWWRQEASVL